MDMDFIYVWDSVQKKVLKYSENGDFLDSYKFGGICIGDIP